MANKSACKIILLTLAIISCITTPSCAQDEADEEVNIISQTASVDGKYIATVYTIFGGGAAGYAYQIVNLRKQEQKFNHKKGNIFVVTRTHNIVAEWKDNGKLIIKHSKIGSVLTKVEEWGDEPRVSIIYTEYAENTNDL